MRQLANAKVVALPDKPVKTIKLRNMLRVPFSRSLHVASPKTIRAALTAITKMAGAARSSHPKLALRQ